MTLGTRLASFPLGIGMAGAGMLTAFLVTGLIPRMLPLPVWIGAALVIVLAGMGVVGAVLFAVALIRNGTSVAAAVIMTLFAAALMCGGTAIPIWYAMTFYLPTVTP
jgi:hypothetical protein